jgi:hypothetical protein
MLSFCHNIAVPFCKLIETEFKQVNNMFHLKKFLCGTPIAYALFIIQKFAFFPPNFLKNILASYYTVSLPPYIIYQSMRIAIILSSFYHLES